MTDAEPQTEPTASTNAELAAGTGVTLTLNIRELLTALGEPTGYDYNIDEAVGHRTIRSEIVHAVKADIVRSLAGPIAEEVRAAITAEITEIVRETLNGTFQKVNTWGEPTGQPTTIREQIAEETKGFLNGRGSGYDHKSPMKDLIREQVDTAFSVELKKTITEAKTVVLDAVRDKGATILSESLKDILEKGR